MKSTLMLNKLSIYLYFALLATLFYSCNKNESPTFSGQKVTLKIKTELSDFQDSDILINNKSSSLYPESIIDTIIELNNDFLLSATLSPVHSGKEGITYNNITKKGNLANNVTLNSDVYYRLAVFKKSDGSYVDERVYQYTKEENTPPLLLGGGIEYTFIAYSVNSTVSTELPQLAGPSTGRTISNSSISVIGDEDLLFFKKDQIMSTTPNDYLNIIFKHQFNQITVSIDGTETGYNTTEVTASLFSPNKTANLTLNDGNITRTGESSTTPLVFSTLNQLIVNSNEVLINTGSGGTLLSIYNLKIGEIVAGSQNTPLIPFTNVALEPGKRYIMKLTVKPNDAYIDDYGGGGVDAVRINGQVWMRHNVRLDGNYSANPDIPSSDIFGNYFQWGRGTSPFNRVIPDIATAPTGWTGVQNNVPNAWNANSNTSPLEADAIIRDQNPVKNMVNDPCPANYRVPSLREIKALTEAVITTSIGPLIAGADAYTSATVLTSKRKSTVKMTIPMQGFYGAEGGSSSVYQWDNEAITTTRGAYTILWTSYFQSATIDFSGVQTANFFADQENISIGNIRGSNGANTVIGMPIRCIAINSSL